MTRIAVAHFTNSETRGGAEEHMLTLLRGFDRELFRPHLVCPPALAQALRDDIPADVAVAPLCWKSPRQWRAGLRLARFLRSRSIEILHSHGFYSSLFASPVGRLAGVRVVAETPHIREYWRKGWLKSRFIVDRAAGWFVDFYIAVSNANARYLVAEKRLPARKVHVVPNGTDLARFAGAGERNPELKARLGFDAGDPVIVVLARLEPQKGHAVLLDAMASVRHAFPPVRLVCLGEGSLRAELESRVATLGLSDCVRFPGFHSDVLPWLELADFTVLPSLFEGLPLAVLESLAAAKAVVATDADGTPEAVIDGVTGFIVPPGDSSHLADAIRTLLADPARCRIFGRNGRKLVEARFDQRDQIRKTEEIYLQTWERLGGTAVTVTAPAGEKTACVR